MQRRNLSVEVTGKTGITDAHLLDGLVDDVAAARRWCDSTRRAAELARRERDSAFEALDRAEQRLQAHINSRVAAACPPTVEEAA